MALDLLHFDQHNPDLHWMYAHATLQRLFRSNSDGRVQFFQRIPGFKSALSRANILCNNFNSADLILQHWLIELEGGWLNILGGTEWPLGWPYHAFSLLEVPALTPADWFIGYWWLVANATLQDIDTVIPANDARPILFSGHSLGGASSVAAAFRDFGRATSRPRAAVTFGSPLTRGKNGMDGRDIPCCRIYNRLDLVPNLPQHLVKVGLGGIFPIKIPLFSLFHHGLGFMVDSDGMAEVGDRSAWLQTGAFTALLALNALGGAGCQPWTVHFMETYTYCLRHALQRQNLYFDPLWDEINHYVNQVEGIDWNLAGFPVVTPPAPPTIAPNPVNLPLAIQFPDLAPFTTDLLNPRPGVPLITGQSLAGYLNANNGAALDDITIHLSQTPVADPLTVDLNSFQECDFSGYQNFGGQEWVTIQPQPWTPATRFAARAVFQCIGEERINTAHAWYAVGHKTGSGQKVLIDWRSLGAPFVFDRPRTLVIEFSLATGPV